jgi:hypothetical protein
MRSGDLFVVFRGKNLPGGGKSPDELAVRVNNQAQADELLDLVKGVNDHFGKSGLGGLTSGITNSVRNIPDGDVFDFEEFIKRYTAALKTDPKSPAGFLDQLFNAVDDSSKATTNPTLYNKTDGSGGKWTSDEVNGNSGVDRATKEAAQSDVNKNWRTRLGDSLVNNPFKTALGLSGVGLAIYAGSMQGGSNGKKINIEKIDIVDVPKKDSLEDVVSDSLNAVITYNLLTLVDVEKSFFKLVIGDELTFSNDVSFGVLKGKTFPISEIMSSTSVKIKLNVTGTLSATEAQQIADNDIDNYCGNVSPCSGTDRTCTVKSDFVNHLANAVSTAVKTAAVFSFLVAKGILNNAGLPTDPDELAARLAAMIAAAISGAANLAAGAAGGAGRAGKFILCNSLPILCNKTIWIMLVGLIVVFIILSTFSKPAK